jgi:hypothetical protein
MKVRLSLIYIIPGWNNRLSYETKEDLELDQSISESGVQNPITGRWEKLESGKRVFVISDGHRRIYSCLRVCKKKKIKPSQYLVPARLEDESLSPGDRKFFQIVLNSGKPLETVEFMNLVHQLHHEFKFDLQEIADRSGKSMVWVANMLCLSEGRTALLSRLIEESRISTTLALEIVKRNGSSREKIDEELNRALGLAGGKKLTGRHFSKRSRSILEKIAGVIEKISRDNSLQDLNPSDLAQLLINSGITIK